MNPPVSLQINLAPGDYPHARYILPHQLNALAKQVAEIILTVDTKPGKGRFAEGWKKYKELLNNFLHNEIAPVYPVKIIPVDYAEPMQKKIADYFLGTTHIPEKDFRGGPFYAYFFGLYTVANNLVFHLDSDMLLGGLSPSWIDEAVDIFKNDSSCFIVSPLPGPPHPDDILAGQCGHEHIAPYTYAFNGMSTRIFMMDKSRFSHQKPVLKKPSARNQVKAMVQGNPNTDLPEHILSNFMEKNHFKRIDFLGAGPGMWSLHPPYRTKAFYENLPNIVADVESGNLPANQYGFYDMVDEVCDWSEAREKLKNNRWWKKAR